MEKGRRERGSKRCEEKEGYQIITRNSKYDSSPICSSEKREQEQQTYNCIASTETKGRKSQCGSALLALRERERLCWVGGTGQNPHSPNSFLSLLSFLAFTPIFFLCFFSNCSLEQLRTHIRLLILVLT